MGDQVRLGTVDEMRTSTHILLQIAVVASKEADGLGYSPKSLEHCSYHVRVYCQQPNAVIVLQRRESLRDNLHELSFDRTL